MSPRTVTFATRVEGGQLYTSRAYVRLEGSDVQHLSEARVDKAGRLIDEWVGATCCGTRGRLTRIDDPSGAERLCASCTVRGGLKHLAVSPG